MRRPAVITLIILCAFIFTLCSSVPICVAVDDAMKSALPRNACGEGWTLDGSVKYYTPDTLFEHINGEAELYFPYGFGALATAIYTNKTDPQLSLLADVYRMSSLLNAFGIYSNYRKARSEDAPIGAEGFVSSTQLMFYQDKYFVRLQSSGPEGAKVALLACGRAVSENLPPDAGRPRELALIKIPGIVPKSERYIARSLLGYAFFRRGVTADAILGGERAQVFVALEDAKDAARKTFENYASYLRSSGKKMDISESPEWISLTAFDPMYGGVFVEQTGPYVIGIIRLKEPSAAKELIGQMRERLSIKPPGGD
jgi:hypothetical protein